MAYKHLATTPGYEASMAQELWIIKASFIASGIRYGFEGDRLREYVEKRLRQSEEFEERSDRRQDGALRTEFDEKLKKMNERIASSKYEGAKRDLLAHAKGRRTRRGRLCLQTISGQRSIRSQWEDQIQGPLRRCSTWRHRSETLRSSWSLGRTT